MRSLDRKLFSHKTRNQRQHLFSKNMAISCWESQDLEEVPLATLMAKLNEIVSSEPEYAEAFTEMVPGNEEKVLPLYEDEDLTHAVIDGETSHASFMEITGLESSGLEIEDGVFVIDGDNVLSSESNFIEALEGYNRLQKAVESVQKNEHVAILLMERKGYPLKRWNKS